MDRITIVCRAAKMASGCLGVTANLMEALGTECSEGPEARDKHPAVLFLDS
jgi:hypothetical protein